MNNRKKMYLLLAIFISLFFGINNVLAEKNIYLKCNYTNQFCRESEWCIAGANPCPNCNIFAILTDKHNGNSETKVINSKDYKAYSFDSGHDYCWTVEPKEGFDNLSCPHCEKSENKLPMKNIELLEKGICPSCMRNGSFKSKMIPIGQQGEKLDIGEIDGTRLIIYSYRDIYVKGEEVNKFTDEAHQVVLTIEGYYYDGRYFYVGPSKNIKEELEEFQIDKVISQGENYFKSDENFYSLYVSRWYEGKEELSRCSTQEKCINDHDYKVLTDTNDSTGIIKEAISKWDKDNIERNKELNEIINFLNNNSHIISIAEQIRDDANDGRQYIFADEEKSKDFIEKSAEFISLTDKLFYENFSYFDYNKLEKDASLNANESVLTYFYRYYLGVEKLPDLSSSTALRYSINEQLASTILLDLITKKMDEFYNVSDSFITLGNALEEIKEYLNLLYEVFAMLRSNPNSYNISNSNQIDMLDETVKEIENINNIYSEKYGFENNAPVVDCETLIGEALIDKINNYLNIIKIAVPIILIALGSINFAKAMFASDEEKMKQAQKDFIKRLAVAILIFLSPIIVNLILSLANKVWPIISPNACGLFE